MYIKMMAGIRFSAIKVKDNLIIDGHHRYVASVLSKVNLDKIPTGSSSATVKVEWNKVEFIQADWDTLARIDMLNRQDASYNNLSLDYITELLKNT